MADQKQPAWVSFGNHVKSLRRQEGWSLQRLAKLTNYSATYHSKVERAVRPPKQGIVEAMDSAFGTNGALLRMWRDVERSESGSGWYEQSGEYEKEAEEIRFFHPFVVPGFFQTEGYARALISDTIPATDEAGMKKIVSARQSWRKRLRTGNGLMLNVIIPEFTLTQPVGGPEVMAEQFDVLSKESQAEGIAVQILPLGLKDFTWTVGAFRLIYINDRSPLLCCEHATGEDITDEAHYVRRLEIAYNKLQMWALSPADSLQKLNKLKESL
ncbi:helix-turn-helix transcriptional regulator [Nocardiopsis sp. NPDC049922]|uniref:helix-turn-helix domain-containing protein n=1 Tax=Nocardiopsis sp. NPDC049922 TaxID=3155157 RepID=UPI0033D6C091